MELFSLTCDPPINAKTQSDVSSQRWLRGHHIRDQDQGHINFSKAKAEARQVRGQAEAQIYVTRPLSRGTSIMKLRCPNRSAGDKRFATTG
jgi:hypothetical protein